MARVGRLFGSELGVTCRPHGRTAFRHVMPRDLQRAYVRLNSSGQIDRNKRATQTTATTWRFLSHLCRGSKGFARSPLSQRFARPCNVVLVMGLGDLRMWERVPYACCLLIRSTTQSRRGETTAMTLAAGSCHERCSSLRALSSQGRSLASALRARLP